MPKKKKLTISQIYHECSREKRGAPRWKANESFTQYVTRGARLYKRCLAKNGIVAAQRAIR